MKLRCARGVVELLAQTAQLIWPVVRGAALPLRIEAPVLRPLFLQNTGASNLMSALDAASASLALESLLKLSAQVRFVTLAVGGDLAASNVRMKAFVLRRLNEHNATSEVNKVLFLDVICLVHVLTRCTINTLKLKSVIPRAYAISWILRLADVKCGFHCGRCQFKPRRYTSSPAYNDHTKTWTFTK